MQRFKSKCILGEVIIASLSLLPFLAAKGRGRKRKVGDENASPNSDARDPYYSFLPIFNCMADAENNFSAMRNNIYPFACVITSNQNTQSMKCVVVYDVYKWIFNDCVTGFDFYFKLHYSLYLNYNPLLGKVWTILQRGIFNVKTDEDKKYTNAVVNDLISSITSPIN